MGKQGEEITDEREALHRRLYWGKWQHRDAFYWQFGRVELERYLRHLSTTVQKTADYIDLDFGKKTWEATSLGWRNHRSRWDYPDRGCRLRSEEVIEHKHLREGQGKTWKGNWAVARNKDGKSEEMVSLEQRWLRCERQRRIQVRWGIKYPLDFTQKESLTVLEECSQGVSRWQSEPLQWLECQWLEAIMLIWVLASKGRREIEWQ